MRLSGKKQLISSAQVGGCLELDVQLAVTILKFIRNCCILLKLLKSTTVPSVSLECHIMLQPSVPVHHCQLDVRGFMLLKAAHTSNMCKQFAA